MEPRVNIQYSIEMKDLESEVRRLSTITAQKLSAIDAAFSQAEDVLGVGTLNKIDQIRADLATVDFMLNDIGTIVNGYLAYRTQPAPTQQAPGPAPVTSPPPVADAHADTDMAAMTEELLGSVNRLKASRLPPKTNV